MSSCTWACTTTNHTVRPCSFSRLQNLRPMRQQHLRQRRSRGTTQPQALRSQTLARQRGNFLALATSPQERPCQAAQQRGRPRSTAAGSSTSKGSPAAPAQAGEHGPDDEAQDSDRDELADQVHSAAESEEADCSSSSSVLEDPDLEALERVLEEHVEEAVAQHNEEAAAAGLPEGLEAADPTSSGSWRQACQFPLRRPVSPSDESGCGSRLMRAWLWMEASSPTTPTRTCSRRLAPTPATDAAFSPVVLRQADAVRKGVLWDC